MIQYLGVKRWKLPFIANYMRKRKAQDLDKVKLFASMFGKAKRFKAVLRASGLSAADAICIGDEIRDFDAARAAGIALGAVTWGYTAGDALRALKPDHTFDTFDEILNRIVEPQAGATVS